MPRTFLTDFWLINKFLILRYAFIILNLYNSGSPLPHNLEEYILHLDVLHLNQLVQGANRVSVSPTFFWMEEKLRTWPCAATYWWLCTWWECPAVMPNRLGVPGPSKLQIGRQHLIYMRSNAMSSSCVQIGYDGIQFDAPKMFKTYVANPLSLISRVFRNIPLRTEDRVMMHQKCVSNTSFVMPNISPLKNRRKPKRKGSSSNHPFWGPYARTKQKIGDSQQPKPTMPPAPENSRLSWVVAGNAKGQGKWLFRMLLHEFGKPLQCCFLFQKKKLSPFSHERVLHLIIVSQPHGFQCIYIYIAFNWKYTLSNTWIKTLKGSDSFTAGSFGSAQFFFTKLHLQQVQIIAFQPSTNI